MTAPRLEWLQPTTTLLFEVSNKTRIQDVPGRHPHPLLGTVALTVHLLRLGSSDPTSLQQTSDCVGQAAIHKSRGRRSRCGGREWTGPYQLETGDMKGRTDPHGPGNLEMIGDRVDATQDLEWSYVARSELPDHRSQTHPLAWLEESKRSSVLVCLMLVSGRGAEKEDSALIQVWRHRRMNASADGTPTSGG